MADGASTSACRWVGQCWVCRYASVFELVMRLLGSLPVQHKQGGHHHNPCPSSFPICPLLPPPLAAAPLAPCLQEVKPSLDVDRRQQNKDFALHEQVLARLAAPRARGGSRAK